MSEPSGPVRDIVLAGRGGRDEGVGERVGWGFWADRGTLLIPAL